MTRVLLIDTEIATKEYLSQAGLDVHSADLGFKDGFRSFAQAPHEFEMIAIDLRKPACFDYNLWGPDGGNDNYKCAVVPPESVTDEVIVYGTRSGGPQTIPRYKIIQDSQIPGVLPHNFGP